MRLNRILVCLYSLFLCSFLSVGNDLLDAAQITLQSAASVKKLGQLKGHTGPVFSLAFSPDSKHLVSGGSANDSSVRLWNIPASSQQALLTGNTKQVAAVAFTADGSKVVSAGYDASVHIWDSGKGTPISTITKSADGASINVDNAFTTFSGDGSVLAYANDLGVGPVVFHLDSRKQSDLTKLVTPFDEGPGNVALNNKGTLLAAVGKENVVHLIDAAGKETGLLKNSEKSDYSGYLVFSRDGAMLAVSNYDTSNIQLWNVQTKQAGPLLVGHKNNSSGTMMVIGLAFSPDGKMLASTSYDKTIRLWDTSSGKQIALLDASKGKGPSALAWSPDGTTIACGDLDGTISLWGVR